MHKFFIILLFAIFQISFINPANYQNHFEHQITCAPSLQKSLSKIQQIPEAKLLISSVLREGPIRIVAKDTYTSKQFVAYWDPDERVICLSRSSINDEASIIGSLLFELHNASVNAKINYYDRLARGGQITREKYIESMEYLEYVNSINTANLTKKGIEMGILPYDALMPTYSTFQEHFSIQQKSGHSAYFGNNFDNLAWN